MEGRRVGEHPEDGYAGHDMIGAAQQLLKRPTFFDCDHLGLLVPVLLQAQMPQ